MAKSIAEISTAKLLETSNDQTCWKDIYKVDKKKLPVAHAPQAEYSSL